MQLFYFVYFVIYFRIYTLFANNKPWKHINSQSKLAVAVGTKYCAQSLVFSKLAKTLKLSSTKIICQLQDNNGKSGIINCDCGLTVPLTDNYKTELFIRSPLRFVRNPDCSPRTTITPTYFLLNKVHHRWYHRKLLLVGLFGAGSFFSIWKAEYYLNQLKEDFPANSYKTNE